MGEKEFLVLLKGYLDGNLNPSDSEIFFQLVASNRYDELLNDYIFNLLQSRESSSALLSLDVSDEIIRNIAISENFAINTIKKSSVFNRWVAYSVAACFLVFVGASIFFTKNYLNGKADKNSYTAGLTYRKNTTVHALQINLEDGTAVVLQPQAVVRYCVNGKAKREVYLEGNAFFDVAKKKEKPFFVYAGGLVTRVLGTSFDVVSAKNGDAKVIVKSGRVQLYARRSSDNPASPEYPEIVGNKSPMVVLPNQMGIYSAIDNSINTTITENPILVKETNGYISTDKEKVSFAFESRRLSDVFKFFEQHYGIDIEVDNPEIYNCLFAGDVTEQDLFTKLKIICLSVNSNFEINGTKILNIRAGM